MLVYPKIDPIALQIGPLAIHWYGISYLVAFGLFYWLATRRLKHPQFAHITQPAPWTRADIEDLLFWGVIGVIAGGRLGYCLFYQPDFYFHHLPRVFAVWDGGMSFHGGMLGVIAAAVLWARRRGRPWMQVTDLVAPCVPLGLASGRVGNFINGELWGRVAPPNWPFAMIYPQSGTLQPRYPSEIYEFLLEGVLLFIILWLYGRGQRKWGQVSGAFLIGYGVLRFIAEFFRAPDAFLGLLAFGLSMGQWLCIPMVIAGVILWGWAARYSHRSPQVAGST